jgi:hypothetical protein
VARPRHTAFLHTSERGEPGGMIDGDTSGTERKEAPDGSLVPP